MQWNLVLRYVGMEDDLTHKYRINIGAYVSMDRAKKIVDKVYTKTGLSAHVK